MSLEEDCGSKITKKKVAIYEKQIKRTLQRLKDVLDTKDQDYVNSYLLKVIETSFHRGYLPQKDILLLVVLLNDLIKYNRKPKNEAEKKKRDWNSTLDNLINFKIDYCAICNSKLHNQGKFPKGYPDKWKLCCGHRDALYLYLEVGGKNAKKDRITKEEAQKFEELFNLEWVL